MVSIRYILIIFLCPKLILCQLIDQQLTIKKKPIIILPNQQINDPTSIGNILTGIVAQKAIEIGRFEVIDRRLIDSILKEQRFQLSGIINQNQIIKAGELASAEEAFIINIIEFGQKGVPKIIQPKQKGETHKDRDENLSSWVIKTLVRAKAKQIEENAKSEFVRRTELENNIQTIISAEVRIINISTGVSKNSIQVNSRYTGGNKNASLNYVLQDLRWKISRKLRGLYSLTSEIMQVNGNEITMLTGKDLGVKKGALFEIASIDKEKFYKERLVKIPGKTRALVSITNVGPNASEAKIIRKWRKILPGLRAYELIKSPRVTQLDIFFNKRSWYELSGRFWLMPFKTLSVSLAGQIGLIEDNSKNNTPYFGLGSSLNLDLFYIWGINPSIGLTVPINFMMRRDDRRNNVFSNFSSPSFDFNFSVQLGQFRDIIFSIKYIFSDVQSKWTYQSNDKDENGATINKAAFWLDQPPSFGPLEGIYFSFSLRKIKF